MMYGWDDSHDVIALAARRFYVMTAGRSKDLRTLRTIYRQKAPRGEHKIPEYDISPFLACWLFLP